MDKAFIEKQLPLIADDLMGRVGSFLSLERAHCYVKKVDAELLQFINEVDGVEPFLVVTLSVVIKGDKISSVETFAKEHKIEKPDEVDEATVGCNVEFLFENDYEQDYERMIRVFHLNLLQCLYGFTYDNNSLLDMFKLEFG